MRRERPRVSGIYRVEREAAVFEAPRSGIRNPEIARKRSIRATDRSAVSGQNVRGDQLPSRYGFVLLQAVLRTHCETMWTPVGVAGNEADTVPST